MTFPETEHERWWTAIVGAVLAVLVLGSVLLPDLVYVRFVWQYFWGPVYADAHDAQCVAWAGGSQHLGMTWDACSQYAGPITHPGYTPVSEIGYAVTLVALLVGVVFLLDRLDVGEDFGMLWSLIPFMFFGGALRVVEDADNAVPDSVVPGIHYPLNVFIISPIIYFVVFGIVLAALVVSVWLARSGRIERYEYGLLASGTIALVLTLVYLGVLVVLAPQVTFHPVFVVLTLVIAVACTGGIWWLTERYWPEVNAGTGYAGMLIVFAHAVDGASNVLGIDWGAELGLGGDLYPKHPVNRFIRDVSTAVLPASVRHFTGVEWPFLAVKLLAATLVVWLFNGEMFEENPRYAVLLLVAVAAVGLGPGTRDMLRATFGV